MLGTIIVGVGSIVGTGGTLIEYTVGEADGNADGTSSPGVTLMICPCATNEGTGDSCPKSSDHRNKHWSTDRTILLRSRRIVLL